ncbi:hypothetical protein PRJ_Dakar_00304 [Faustovirus]|nr:hypothetical protein PRJ_Dakar_00304 [Faustovirus]
MTYGIKSYDRLYPFYPINDNINPINITKFIKIAILTARFHAGRTVF